MSSAMDRHIIGATTKHTSFFLPLFISIAPVSLGPSLKEGGRKMGKGALGYFTQEGVGDPR